MDGKRSSRLPVTVKLPAWAGTRGLWRDDGDEATAVHNIFRTRPDGTTAAERFCGQTPHSMFAAMLGSVELPQKYIGRELTSTKPCRVYSTQEEWTSDYVERRS